jgi:hypothetical protein
MSHTLNHTLCPRCRSTDITVVAHSPIEGVWTMTSCQTCWYAWRSTEAAEATDADVYPNEFRLTAADLLSAPATV